jgi:Predicted ATPase of the ABC class
VTSIALQGISTIVVIGGSGDWFDVQDTTIMMDNYNCLDVSKKARSICKTFCTGRVQFNGRGLVHQLPWPLAEDSTPLSSEHYSGGGIMKGGVRVGRMLCSMKLPSNFNQGGSVTASEDGHSVTFRSTYCGRSSCADDDSSKKRKMESSSYDDLQLSDPSRALGTRVCPVESKGVERSITLDISKLEQRISTKEGALGIAFAIIFVEAVLSYSQMNCGPQSFSNSSNTRSVTERTADVNVKELGESKEIEGTKAAMVKTFGSDESTAYDDAELTDNRLSTLLRRFDSLRGSWHVRRHNKDQSIKTGAFSSEMQNLCGLAAKVIHSERDRLFTDLEMAHKIHSEFLCLQDFTWPRSFEVAASINRMRGSYFTQKIFID